jgi:flagellar M-ring protein FliF
MPPFLQTLAKLPARSKLALGGSALAIVLVAFFMLRLASAPSYTTLMSGMDPAQTGKITAALDAQGIPYELQANGAALAVDKSQVAQARVALAGQGISTTGADGQAGFELFDKQKLGASDFQQQVTYQRALEGEIARTIGQVQGVQGAQVQLVLPKDDLFADTASPASAAVMLQGSADALAPGAVRGIAQLTASSVQGLKPENVTITDGTGAMLWPQGDAAGGAGGAGGLASKQAAQGTYERQLEANLDAMLARTLGPGKAQVQVNADLNVDKTTLNSLTYAKKGVPLHVQDDKERLRGTGARAGGTAGTGGNIPTYSAGAGAAGGNSNYQKSSKTTDFGVNKTVARTEKAPGTVQRLQVALVVDQSVSPAVVNNLKQAVASAAGVDPKRGDPPVAVAQMPFAKAPTPKAGPVPVGLLGPLKWAGLGLAALLFCFFMARHLRKREGETLAQPSWLTTIEEPVALAELERTREPVPAPADLPDRRPDQGMHQLGQLVEREPERVAAQLRQWMAED